MADMQSRLHHCDPVDRVTGIVDIMLTADPEKIEAGLDYTLSHLRRDLLREWRRVKGGADAAMQARG